MRRLAACLILACSAMTVSAAFALAAPQSETKYVGKTKQGRTINLEANAKHVRMQSFSIELDCRDGSILVDQESGFEPSALKGGKFSDTQYGSTDKVTYKGKVQGKKITGTLQVRDTVGKVKCSSPTVKFTAKAR